MYEKNNEETKYRYFAFLIYKHDKDGQEIWTTEKLEQALIRKWGMFAISPEHQPDEDDPDVHWHVVYKHPNTVRASTVHQIVDDIAYNKFVLCLHHPNIYQRYLIHLDNPEKQQFTDGVKAITLVGGFPLDLMPELTQAQKYEIQKELESFVTEFNIREYASLVDYTRDNCALEYYIFLTTHTFHFKAYLDSKRNSEKEMERLQWKVEFENKMREEIENIINERGI